MSARHDGRPVLLARALLIDGVWHYRIRFEDGGVVFDALELFDNVDPIDAFRQVIESYTGTDWTVGSTLIRTDGKDPILAYYGPNA